MRGDIDLKTILIVEDNDIIRQSLIEIVNENFKGINILGVDNGEKAIEIFENQHIDLFLLDINLPDQSGMDIAEKIRSIAEYEHTYIIFTTGGISCIPEIVSRKYHSYDFLEKPFTKAEVIELVQYGLTEAEKKTMPVESEPKLHILLKQNIYLMVKLEDIYFIESNLRTVMIHTVDEIIKTKKNSLKQLEKKINQIDSNQFMRVHKSYLVNLTKVRRVEVGKNIAGVIQFSGYKETAMIGKKYEKEFLKKIKYLGI